jgi:hypothetical protein
VISCSADEGSIPIQKGPCCWDYKSVSLIADGHPRKEQKQLVDQLNPKATPRISHIHHFDDDNNNCIGLEIVWIEPQPSVEEIWAWLSDWDGSVPIRFGVVPNFRP